MNRAHSIFNAAGRDLLYVLGVLAASIIEFAAWVTGVSVTASLLVLVIGLLVWLSTVLIFRVIADVDRRTAGWYRRRPIRGAASPTSRWPPPGRRPHTPTPLR